MITNVLPPFYGSLSYVCKTFLPAYNSAKIIKIDRDFPELYDHKCTATFLCSQCIYVCFKKLYPFYFCNNFVGDEPILIILGKNVAKEIGNTCLLLTVRMSYSVAGVAENTWCSMFKIAKFI